MTVRTCALPGLALALLALVLAPACRPVPGLYTPMVVAGAQFQLRSAQYNHIERLSFTPTDDEVLEVTGEVLGGAADPQAWRVWLTDAHGRRSNPAITTVSHAAVGPRSITWTFGVARGMRAFTLHVPGDQTIRVDVLIQRTP